MHCGTTVEIGHVEYRGSLLAMVGSVAVGPKRQSRFQQTRDKDIGLLQQRECECVLFIGAG